MTEQAKLPIYLVVALASIFIIMLGIKTTAAIINPILLALVITIAVLPLPQKLVTRGMSEKMALAITNRRGCGSAQGPAGTWRLVERFQINDWP